jgi:rsbT co-antagonist protein RsbR
MTEELRREIAALRARTAELEERLAAQERAAQVQSERLAKTAAEADERTQELVRSEDELRRQANILRLVLDSMTDGVVVVDERGELVLANPAATRMLEQAGVPASVQGDQGTAEGLLFLPDQRTPLPAAEHPLARALRGEPVEQVEIFVRPPKSPAARRSGDDREPRSSRAGAVEPRFHDDGSGLFVTVTANPMRRRDGSISGAVAVYRDATERKRLIEDLEAKNRELFESEQAKSDLVERLRLAIDEVSTPILELWDNVLALPVIGVVDSRRSAQIMERLLEEIVQRQSRYVILDLTGVEMIDTRTADHFLKLMKAVWLLGAECRITGVRPAVAQTLVDLGINLAGVRASRNLKHALRDLLQIAGPAHPRLDPGRTRSARKETAT